MKAPYRLKLIIKRTDPDIPKSWYQTYELEAGRILRFTDLFRKINQDLDPTLAWNSSCEHAQCGSCSVKINGRPMLACELLVETAVARFGTTRFVIEPINIAPVVRDLVVDFEQAYERVHRVKPYIIQPAQNPNDSSQYMVSPRELERYVEATRCINCFCCASACISSHRGFLGPNAVMASAVRILDPREDATAERLKLLYSDEGVYRCHTSRACSHVCPKEIDVAHFIGLIKAGAFQTEDN
ncbi:succinate dehydrogenase/fumarate reductase iron-sulfur subunit [bacterium]|nr:succinate dehydrogenase/fumarate reductase iron-sulfur subunit [bacterium]